MVTPQRRVMPMEYVQALVTGLLAGSALALVAMGFSLVWGVLNVINLAQGALVLGGAYLAWELTSATGLDPFLLVPVVAVVLFGVGYLLQRYVINLVIRASVFVTIILTYGLNLLLTNGFLLGFTADDRTLRTSYSDHSIWIGPLYMPVGQLITFGLALVATLALVAFADHTRLGLAIRATGMNVQAARLTGAFPRHIYSVTFGISAALAGIAGIALGVTGTFNPSLADALTLESFVVAILGGLGNMWGAFVGGLVLGAVQGLAVQFAPGTLNEAISFGLLVVVLAVRPQGLFGRPYYGTLVEA